MDKIQLISSLREKGYEEQIISAFEKVQREKFVPEHLTNYAYEDIAIPLEDGSSLSQPSTIAFVLSLLQLKQNQKILEIGSGSGYVLSLMSEIIKSGKIYGLEINKSLAVKSKTILEKDSNVTILNKSGFLGFSDSAPYDRILFSASCSDLRIPVSILNQLAHQGILVVPIKSSIFQIKKLESGKTEKNEFPGFSFVSLKEE